MRRPARISPLLALLVLAAASGAPAMEEAEADSLFREANRAYREGRFAEAAADYEEIRAAGFLSGELFYNLGNAYFQMNDLGRSMANYHRAARLLPRDTDLRANMRLLEERILDRSIIRDRLPLLDLLRSAAAALTPAEWFLLAEILYGALLLLLAIPLLRPRLGPLLRSPARGTAVFLLIAILGASWRAAGERANTHGVILAGEVSARSGPGERFTEEFLLHEGTTIRIHREAEGWALVTVSHDLKGWIPEEAIEPI